MGVGAAWGGFLHSGRSCQNRPVPSWYTRGTERQRALAKGAQQGGAKRVSALFWEAVSASACCEILDETSDAPSPG